MKEITTYAHQYGKYLEDSNFIFGKKGRRVMTTEEIYEADFDNS